ncbi:restriction endonuclease subunit S [Brachybacterium paraconglomeratum]|uniref:restriction endonuclease subunit S n=1 Tax=Brachybacterium paraconglomeratum TaxID=173362 RepID=UPI0037C6B7B4
MSDEQWIDNLPSTWTMARLGALGQLSKGSGGSKEDNRDTGVAVVRYGELYGKFDRVIRQAQSFVSPEDASRYTPLPTGSLVFAGSGEDPEEIGKSALSLLPSPAFVGGDSIIFSPRTDVVDPLYLTYVLDSQPLRAYKAVRSTGFTVVHINAGKLKTLPIPLPLLDEQRAIADYLDHETAQIDALVAKQEEFIGLLRERRAAAIDKTITAIVASQIPLRRALRYLTSGSRGWGAFYSNEGERFLRIGNLSRGNLSLRGNVQNVRLPESVTEGARTRLRRRDLLFSITAYIGSVAVVDDPDWVDGYVSQHVALSRLDESRLDPHYVGWVMLSTAGQDQLKQGAAGGTKVQLALDDIRELVVPAPPVEEQIEIALYLNEQTSRIDTLIAKAEEHIALAKERRSALITAAVTGQTDVRTAAQKAS